MNFLKKIIVIFFFLIHSSISLAQVTHVDNQTFEDGGSSFLNGIAFNSDGTKMFTSYLFSTDNDDIDFINEYDLSTPFDISTHTYAGDSERCNLANGYDSGVHQKPSNIGDITFSSNGMHIFTLNRGTNNADNDKLYRYDLTKPFDVSTCTLAQQADAETSGALNDWRSGAVGDNHKYHHMQGVAISPDGTKVFISFNGTGGGAANGKDGIREYTLSTPFDITTLTHEDDAGILLPNSGSSENPDAIHLSADGKRIFVVYHSSSAVVEQYSLSIAYDTTNFTLDGAFDFNAAISGKTIKQARALAFSALGLKMFVSNDRHSEGIETIYEFDLSCPFNIITSASCQTYKSKERTSIAEAQAELAKRTINLSTNSALNRLKWIRRNQDKQNLSNQNIKLNFSNNLISSISQLPISSFKQIVSKKSKDKSGQKYFYWSEGSVSIGRVGDTSISSTKVVEANSLTFGFDKFTEKKGIQGYAFRFGNDETTLGINGSELDTETFNITYYSSAPMKNDDKLIDRIFGIGKIRSDILTVIDGQHFPADRNGNQIYGTVKVKDEIKRNNLIFIPSGQFDIGHTLLDRYEETVNNNGVIVDKQHVKTKNLRATLAVTQDLSNDKYEFKRHGKIEYLADLDRSSDFKYNYIFDKETKYAEKLHTGSLHNINAEIGLDIVFPNRYSIFIIYERNQTIKSAHSAQNDNLYIAIGYLPYEGAEYAFTINGSENLLSKLEFKKNINGLNLSFNFNDDLTNLGDNREANIALNKVF